MKFGIKKTSINKSIAARTSVSRAIRHNLGLKAPRGMGWITNPKKAAYNRVYNRTTFSIGKSKVGGALIFILVFGIVIAAIKLLFWLLSEIFNLFSNSKTSNQLVQNNDNNIEDASSSNDCPRCSSLMVKRMAKRGSSKGIEFWGCSKFPRCRGTREIQLEESSKKSA